jgi:hypothetical protein
MSFMSEISALVLKTVKSSAVRLCPYLRLGSGHGVDDTDDT